MEDIKNQLATRLKTANNILITCSSNPTVDQLSAVIGLTLLLNKLGKHAAAVFSGAIPSTIEFLKPEKTLERNTDSLRDFIISLDKAKADKLRYKIEDKYVKIFITPYHASISENDLVFSQGDFNVDLVVALGVQKKEDLDNAITAHGNILHDATVATLTTTEISSLGTLNWSSKDSSSLCEMLVVLGGFIKKEGLLDAQIANALLTGIVAETQRFSNAKTTATTMTLSSELLAAGANQQLVANALQPKPEPEAPKPPEPPKVEIPKIDIPKDEPPEPIPEPPKPPMPPKLQPPKPSSPPPAPLTPPPTPPADMPTIKKAEPEAKKPDDGTLQVSHNLPLNINDINNMPDNEEGDPISDLTQVQIDDQGTLKTMGDEDYKPEGEDSKDATTEPSLTNGSKAILDPPAMKSDFNSTDKPPESSAQDTELSPDSQPPPENSPILTHDEPSSDGTLPQDPSGPAAAAAPAGLNDARSAVDQAIAGLPPNADGSLVGNSSQPPSPFSPGTNGAPPVPPPIVPPPSTADGSL